MLIETSATPGEVRWRTAPMTSRRGHDARSTAPATMPEPRPAAAASTGVTVPSTTRSTCPTASIRPRCRGTRPSPSAATPAAGCPRDAVLRIADVDGDACVQLLVFNADAPAERLNVADTVKVQWQAYLGPGALLLSDMGRVLMTIVGDTQRPPRLPLRRLEPAAATRRGTATAAIGSADAERPRAAGRRRAPSSGLDAARPRRPASTCSSGSRVADDGGARRSTATPRAGAATSSCGPRWT